EHQDGHHADGAGEQESVATKDDCQHGSSTARVEAVDGRDAGHDRVGHRLWQHRESEVSPGGGVVGEPTERHPGVGEMARLERFRHLARGLTRRPAKSRLPVPLSRITKKNGWSARNTAGSGRTWRDVRWMIAPVA